MPTNYYYYDKYELLEETETETTTETEVTDSTTIYKNQTESDMSISGETNVQGPSASQWSKRSDEIYKLRTVNGYDDYRFKDAQDLNYEDTLAYERDENESLNLSIGDTYYKYEYGGLNTKILRCRITDMYFEYPSDYTIIYMEKVAEVSLVKETYEETETTEESEEILISQNAGKLLDKNVLKPSSYPKNGAAFGYWWVRKRLYTIPAPKLKSPVNAFIGSNDGYVNNAFSSGFVCNLTPRFWDTDYYNPPDEHKYHIRVRMGKRSDFQTFEHIAESKENIDRFYWFSSVGAAKLEVDTKQPYPAEGVYPTYREEEYEDTGINEDSIYYNVGERRLVWFEPPGEWIPDEAGFYYWDITAFHPNWGYGIPSEHRLLIITGEMSGKYFLNIGGVPYNALKLNLTEASNGSVGKIEVNLSNHNL